MLNSKNTLVCALAGLAVASSASFGAVITQWNFEAGNTTPSTGAGIAALVGGTTATFAAGNGGGQGWNTTAYAAQSAGSGTRGVEFFASTAGYENIEVTYDHRASGTASRWSEIQYTIDGGTNWTAVQNNSGGLSPHDTFYGSGTIVLPALADEIAGFGVRIVSIFAPVAFDQNATLADFGANAAYMRANAQAVYTAGGGVGTGDYAGGGTWRFDNVTISGTAVPEPTSLAMIGLAGLIGLRRRR